ncbi:Hypothetical predicted protein [Paramuricea clavata]|uniref:Uncharacterized protein n=1 Tax=Paramuricea clavata TaxID=317549 RepID=A0A7D9IUX1_PARCT|nr:Hypothetical predicted protein [Paramuricea clavata]
MAASRPARQLNSTRVKNSLRANVLPLQQPQRKKQQQPHGHNSRKDLRARLNAKKVETVQEERRRRRDLEVLLEIRDETLQRERRRREASEVALEEQRKKSDVSNDCIVARKYLKIDMPPV